MPRYDLTVNFPNEGSRNDVRMRVIEAFSRETPGTGRDDLATKYYYYVEALKSGDHVYLERPANLYNGFDFVIHLEGANFAEPGKRARNFPKHEDITKDLELKKAENPTEYQKLYALLRKVYECHDVSDTEIDEVHFTSGLPVEHVVKVIKWFFIEQDIRYWNYSGRGMTWGIIPEP